MPKLLSLIVLGLIVSPAIAQRTDRAGNADRWNIAGPAWYETECGHRGFSPSHGLPDQKWRKPCSVPIRVCEFGRMTLSYPADPDVPCEQMVKPMPEGGLQRTYIQRWN